MTELHKEKLPRAAETLSPGEQYLRVAKEYVTFEHVDWQHAPLKGKLYRGCPTITLSGTDALVGPQAEPCSFPLSSTFLSQFLATIYGLTRQMWISIETVNALIASSSTMATLDPTRENFHMNFLRTVPSGGGLFPAEVYLALAPGTANPPFGPGLYHYDALHHALDVLNSAPMRMVLAQALARADMAQVPLTLLLTCTFWRTAFKYRDFSYRLHSLDLGVLVAQCLEVARACSLSATVHYQFLDHVLNQQIGLDPLHESVYAVITLTSPQVPGEVANEEEAISGIQLPPPEVLTRTQPISDFPLVAALHNQAMYRVRSDLQAAGELDPLAVPPGARVAMQLAQPLDLLTGLKHRHSARHTFQPGTLSYNQFTRLLQAVGGGYENDLDVRAQILQHTLLYCLVNQVERMEAGVYCYTPATNELILVRAGDLRAEHQTANPYATLQNVYQLSLCLFPVVSYSRGFQVYGDRWYRIQNMEAGLLLQRLALASAALHVGCQLSLAYTVEVTNRLLRLPNDQTALAQVLLAPERSSGQSYELPLIG